MIVVLVFFVVLMALLLRPRPSSPEPTTERPPQWISENGETQVSLLPGTGERVYAFAASITDETLVAVRSSTPNFAFAASISDDKGQEIARFDDRLHIAALSLAPYEGSYHLSLSPKSPNTIGSVTIAVGAAAASQGSIPATILSKAAPPCQMTVNTTAGVIRSAPATDYEVLGLLSQGAFLPVLGRTDDGWYAVNFNERQSWVSGEVATLNGTCDLLPRLLNPAIPAAPTDADIFMLEVDRDGSGRLREALSTPQGDPSDIIWLRVINLYTQAPNNYREFTITLNCTGIGAEYLRWGSPYEPTLRCGESATLPFLFEISQQPIAVVFEANSLQSYVEYMLTLNGTNSAPLSLEADASGAVG
jgi:hypothetical protein